MYTNCIFLIKMSENKKKIQHEPLPKDIGQVLLIVNKSV